MVEAFLGLPPFSEAGLSETPSLSKGWVIKMGVSKTRRRDMEATWHLECGCE